MIKFDHYEEVVQNDLSTNKNIYLQYQVTQVSYVDFTPNDLKRI